MGRRLPETGLVIGTWGNVSVRLGNRMITAPTGADYTQLTDADLASVEPGTAKPRGRDARLGRPPRACTSVGNGRMREAARSYLRLAV